MDPNWLVQASQDAMQRRGMENQQAADYMQSQPVPGGQGGVLPTLRPGQDQFAAARNAVSSQYPVLAPHLKNSVISYGTSMGPNDDRQLEFYHPWDGENPNPGKNTIEIFNRGLKGDDLHAAIAGDLLHRLGSKEPSTGLPVDPKFYQLRQELSMARDVNHRRMDRDAYQREQSSPYPPGEYPAWDQHSRLDSYVRAGLFPDQNPQWAEAITPAMQPIIDRMNAYLKGGR